MIFFSKNVSILPREIVSRIFRKLYHCFISAAELLRWEVMSLEFQRILYVPFEFRFRSFSPSVFQSFLQKREQSLWVAQKIVSQRSSRRFPRQFPTFWVQLWSTNPHHVPLLLGPAACFLPSFPLKSSKGLKSSKNLKHRDHELFEITACISFDILFQIAAEFFFVLFLDF